MQARLPNQYSPLLLTGDMQETHLTSAQQSPVFPMPVPSAAIMSVPMLVERNQSIDRQPWLPIEDGEAQQQYEVGTLNVERVNSVLEALQEDPSRHQGSSIRVSFACVDCTFLTRRPLL